MENISKNMQKLKDDFYIDKNTQLGRGNFGKVYKGYNMAQNRIIAIKFINQLTIEQYGTYQRQILVMEQLSKIRHPHIMGYYGYHKDKQGIYLFLESCNGGSLKNHVTTRISQLKVLTLLRQIIDAMTYINSLNKVHRDLKPDNILLDQNKQIKIADFGLARQIDVIMSKNACTPLYAAPQVLNEQQYNQKCDVWSAGLILYQILIGKPLFGAVKNLMQLKKQHLKFKSGDRKIIYTSSLHKKWSEITSMMLTYNKKDRPSFTQLLSYFDKVKEQIQTDLIKKYGYQTQDLDQGLNITRTVSPYQSIPFKMGKVDLLKKLRQQRSYNNLNSLRKYFVFFRMKNDYFNKLIKEFTSNNYPNMKNVYKYMLMFLSASTYVSRLQHISKQLKQIKFSTPQGPLNQSDFQDFHKQQLKSLINEYCNKNETSILKFKKVIQNQIINKILGTYMKRQQQKKVIQSTQNILQMIEQVNKGIFKNQQDYFALYKRIVKYPEVYINNKLLQNLSLPDLKTYLCIRVIANIDQVFSNTNYLNDDYIKMKKQDLQNLNTKQILENLQYLN